MYADTITGSMRRCIDETERRRMKQMRYNEENGITPTQIVKPRKSLLDNEQLTDTRTSFEAQKQQARVPQMDESLYNLQVADDSSPANLDRRRLQPFTKEQLQAEIDKTKQKMLAAAKALDFMEAANLRDYMLMLSEKLEHLK
jgi:excinuclease ABC subunit B